MKKMFLIILIMINISQVYANDIQGLWQIPEDEETGRGAVIYVYKYDDKYHGKIVAITLNGKLLETYKNPQQKAENLKGNPFFVGTEVIWDLKKYDDKYAFGKIIQTNKKKAKTYELSVKMKDGKLELHPTVLGFGPYFYWDKIEKLEDENFNVEDFKNFKPNIVQGK